MADIGVDSRKDDRLKSLRARAQYQRFLTRLVDIELRREEINIELEQLSNEEVNVRENIKNYELTTVGGS